MSTRERWIVYPLLFLTLGIAMRNQFMPTNLFKAMDLRANDIQANELQVRTIRCNNLDVMEKGRCSEIEFKRALGDQVIVNGYLKSLFLRSAEGEFSQIRITDVQGKPVVVMLEDQNTKAGVIQTMTADGAPQVQIHSNNTGGVVQAIGHLGQALVAMGHEGKVFGVFGQYPQQGPPFPLTSLWPFQPQSATPKIVPVPPPKTSPEEKNEGPKKDSKKEDAGKQKVE
jgi:hypothetical protein